MYKNSCSRVEDGRSFFIKFLITGNNVCEEMGIYRVVGGIDTYDKLNINPLLSITYNKKKAGRKKKTSNEKLSYTEVWNGREMFPLFIKSS